MFALLSWTMGRGSNTPPPPDRASPTRPTAIPAKPNKRTTSDRPMNFVMGSAGLVWPGTFCSTALPSRTACCSQRSLTSRCLSLPNPQVEAKALAAEESVHATKKTDNAISRSIDWRPNPLDTASVKLYSSASHDDVATTGCVADHVLRGWDAFPTTAPHLTWTYGFRDNRPNHYQRKP